MIGVRSTYYQSEGTLANVPSNIAFNNFSLPSDYNQFTLETETAIEMDGFDARDGY
jgi:hypothetical protein